MALGAAGLRYLSRVDRSSEQLMRERRHTDGVYDFVSLLMSSCRESRVWSLVQALPAHRWERRYKYGTRRRGRFRDINARRQA